MISALVLRKGCVLNSVFSYTDYRAYLQDYYAEKKLQHTYFSYQYLANKAGFKTREMLFRIMKGERNLTAAAAHRLSEALGHTEEEKSYFTSLVGFNQSADHSDRDHYFRLMSQVNAKDTPVVEAIRLRHDEYEIFAHWHHVAIRALVELQGFSGDYDALARSLSPAISAAQAKNSIALLERLGQIRCTEAGEWIVVHKTITTGPEVKRHALRDYYRDLADLAICSIDDSSREERNLSSLMLGISDACYDRIVDRLAEVRTEILSWAADDTAAADRVYAINMHLFPLSHPLHKDAS